MKYMPTYDQVIIMDLGLKSQYGHLIDLMINASIWAEKVTVNNEDYYFLDYGKIIEELPTVVNSKPRITKIVSDLRDLKIVKTINKGRSNWFKVDKDLTKYWGKNNKNKEYKTMLKNKFNHSGNGTVIVQETERSGNGTFRKRNDKGGNHSGNGTVIVQETESINQPTNKPTNNKPTIERERSKKSKNKNMVLPKIADVVTYAESRNASHIAKPFFDYFDASEKNGRWYDSFGNPVKNWKQKFISWQSRDKNNFAETVEAETQGGRFEL